MMYTLTDKTIRTYLQNLLKEILLDHQSFDSINIVFSGKGGIVQIKARKGFGGFAIDFARVTIEGHLLNRGFRQVSFPQILVYHLNHLGVSIK